MKKLMDLFLLITVFLCGCASSIDYIKENQIDAFQTTDVLSVERFGHAAVGYKDNIFIIGGTSKKGYVRKIEKYNTKTGEKELLETKIIPRRYLSAVEHQGKIYILGGSQIIKDTSVTAKIMNSERMISNSVKYLEVFDPETGKIKRLSDMPAVRKKAGLVAKDGKLYVIGGSVAHLPYWRKDSASNETEVGLDFKSSLYIYDIESDSWTTGSNMSNEKECNAVLKDDKIYVIGGYDGYATNSIEVYDINNDNWETEEDAPFGISANSITLKDNLVYIFGDYTDLNRVATYNLKTKKWKKINSNFRHSRHNAAVEIDNNIYIIGGNGRLKANNRLECLNLIQKYALK